MRNVGRVADRDSGTLTIEGAAAGSNTAALIRPVDERPPLRRLLPLAFQHVLVIYARAVTVPLVVLRALDLPPPAMALLVNADLVACGIATLIQTRGLWRVGIRLRIMMRVTFASISPMLALIGARAAENAPAAMLATIYGAVIVAGLFGLFLAPLVGRLARLFPPVVTGTVILMIGLSLMRIAIDWAAGGLPMHDHYGAPRFLALAMTTLLAVLALMRFGRGTVRSGALLLGAVAGTLIAIAAGKTDFSSVAAAPRVAMVRPFQFGALRFDLTMSLSMCLVMVIVMVESFGMFMAAGTLVDRVPDRRAMVRGLRGNAVGTVIGGVFSIFSYTSYAQNVGLLSGTGVRSGFVRAGGGAILILLGLSPRLAAVVAEMPIAVLGGAGLVMFGMIAASGIRILLGSVEMTSERLLTVAASLAVGLIPVLSDQFFQHLLAALSPLTHSGIVVATLTAVLLNLFLRPAKPA